ncbi:MAG: helix-turn-helix domain-containing protein [Clostridia bacterium]|nr:helix-turn-helix domain-containing protein [Clostridia bacterium]
MSFANNLYYLRKQSGISQEELADRLNVSRQAVSKWETGESYPETEKIIAICDMYGVTMDELIRGDITVKKENDVPDEPQTKTAETIPDENQGDHEENEKNNPHKAAEIAIIPILWTASAIIYLILGIFLSLWHPAWIIFVFMPAVISGVEIAFVPKEKRLKKVLGFIESLAIFGSTTGYLLCGFLLGWWGTMWVLFLLIPITGAICEIFKQKKK